MTTNFRGLLASLWAVLFLVFGWAEADFTNSFDGVAAGSTLSLAWSGVDAQSYPLSITVQLIDKSADGTKANAYRANITTSISSDSFSWTGIPYPVRWIETGLYQLELRPSTPTSGGDTPLLAKSPFFKVQNQAVEPATSSSPSPSPVPSSDASGVNKPLAIGLGVAIGLPSVVALVVVSWCFRKRQRRAALEKRRLMRRDFIIH
ncbi:hypothetical protein B0T26DRAFT_673071 [Lasiosphaeria miniovina]|uniref:Uncharacterized protein n=1 Tax=Lasiosphaeria miniovina TaxID=1954250 RepID=A0AA40B6E6_9PEZI|nr:uncharacterized protein B0T26DRAFT_673071 [Lasiosphaeria miniovina]KAK0728560.1 hypothetical protein B0T26DRAFT_673071 [Lasiosphaeria miniovina]